MKVKNSYHKLKYLICYCLLLFAVVVISDQQPFPIPSLSQIFRPPQTTHPPFFLSRCPAHVSNFFYIFNSKGLLAPLRPPLSGGALWSHTHLTLTRPSIFSPFFRRHMRRKPPLNIISKNPTPRIALSVRSSVRPSVR